ncbi:DUF4007 family protein [Cupriavidus sp. DL-D2]|uniref:DUF4007 family protein n=1 Tax=Cupriavidus sp. DL-D2 TaxID=3144974 RepID=UPI003215B1B7
MIRYPQDLKPIFSGHETFPLRQLWLRKAYDQVALHGISAPKTVFSADDAIERFGVGKNMVAAIRHWGLACGVITEASAGEYSPGSIGRFLFGEEGADPFLERPGSLWLVHWLLAGRAPRSATWFWVFNFIQNHIFTASHVAESILAYAQDAGLRLSPTTIRRDVDVCLRCYSTPSERNITEDLAEPLLVELGILSQGEGNTFQFHRGAQYSLPDEIFVYAILDFWARWRKNSGTSQATLSFNAIAHEYGSPGRVFKLDEDSVADRLSKIEDITRGALKWTDTAGVRQVALSNDELLEEENILGILVRAYA